jgi:predicted GNAT family N-acyltransferase
MAPELLAYARLVPAGLKFPEASIGRVVTAPGRAHRAWATRSCRPPGASLQVLWGPQPIRIGAQAHLQAFYNRHGFVSGRQTLHRGRHPASGDAENLTPPAPLRVFPPGGPPHTENFVEGDN